VLRRILFYRRRIQRLLVAPGLASNAIASWPDRAPGCDAACRRTGEGEWGRGGTAANSPRLRRPPRRETRTVCGSVAMTTALSRAGAGRRLSGLEPTYPLVGRLPERLRARARRRAMVQEQPAIRNRRGRVARRPPDRLRHPGVAVRPLRWRTGRRRASRPRRADPARRALRGRVPRRQAKRSGTLIKGGESFRGTWTDGCFREGTGKASFGVPLSACP
jgi:hypothetical protein